MESHSIHLFVVLHIQCTLIENVLEKKICHCWVGGLTPREAAREAFQLDCFQNMGDPLADLDPTLGPVVKEVSVDFI